MVAKTSAIEIDQTISMADLFGLHFVEKLRGGGIVGPKTLGKLAVDAAILLFEGDSQRQDLPLTQLLEIFRHEKAPPDSLRHPSFYESSTKRYCSKKTERNA